MNTLYHILISACIPHNAILAKTYRLLNTFTGNSLLQAFDRLEVMELTANSILDSQSLGSIVHISEAEIAELKTAFHLEG